jgi:hypothetical protein
MGNWRWVCAGAALLATVATTAAAPAAPAPAAATSVPSAAPVAAPAATTPVAAPTAPAAAGRLPDGYYRYSGTLGQIPIVLHLTLSTPTDEASAGNEGTAYYLYPKHMVPIPLEVHRRLEGGVSLAHTTGAYPAAALPEKEQEWFELAIDGQGLRGTWRQGLPSAKGKELPVVVQPDYTGALPFRVEVYQASTPLDPAQPKGASASTEALLLIPAPDGAAADGGPLFGAIRDLLCVAMVSWGEKTAKPGTADCQKTPEALFAVARDQLFADYAEERKTYQECLAAAKKAGQAPECGNAEGSGGFSREFHMEILRNDGGIATVALAEYLFTGGAHPNSSTRYLTLALAAKKRVAVHDLFPPEADARLSKLLEATFRREQKLGPKDELGLLVDKIPPAENYLVDGGGVTFHYDPYEIGAYAMGPIEIQLTAKEVLPLLRPDAPAEIAHLLGGARPGP